MPNSRREFIRKSMLLSGAAGFNFTAPVNEKYLLNENGA